MIKQTEGSRQPKVTGAVEVAIPQTTKTTATVAVKIVPQTLKKSIIQRDQSCQYKNHSTGKICASRWNLHIDHVHPRWAGGSNNKENLRVLCARHNRHVYQKQAQIKLIYGQV